METHLEQNFLIVAKIISENFDMKTSRMDRGSIEDLNFFPIELIKKLRNLDHQGKILSVLRFYCSQDNWEYLNHFIHAVIRNNEDVLHWQKGRLLVPDYSLKDQLTKPFSEIYYASYGKTLLIKKPDFNSWQAASHCLGAFVIREVNSNYKTQIPQGFIPYGLSEDTCKVSLESRLVWFRRCIATRIAGYLLSINQLGTFSDKNILHDIASIDEWTIDAVMAFEGLLREQRELGWNDGEIPGYIGPDSFYE
jgi:hypothetical protein